MGGGGEGMLRAWRLCIPLLWHRVASCVAPSVAIHSSQLEREGHGVGVVGQCILCRYASQYNGYRPVPGTRLCMYCDSSSRLKGAYGTTDEDFLVLTCACLLTSTPQDSVRAAQVWTRTSPPLAGGPHGGGGGGELGWGLGVTCPQGQALANHRLP